MPADLLTTTAPPTPPPTPTVTVAPLPPSPAVDAGPALWMWVGMGAVIAVVVGALLVALWSATRDWRAVLRRAAGWLRQSPAFIVASTQRAIARGLTHRRAVGGAWPVVAPPCETAEQVAARIACELTDRHDAADLGAPPAVRVVGSAPLPPAEPTRELRARSTYRPRHGVTVRRRLVRMVRREFRTPVKTGDPR